MPPAGAPAKYTSYSPQTSQSLEPVPVPVGGRGRATICNTSIFEFMFSTPWRPYQIIGRLPHEPYKLTFIGNAGNGQRYDLGEEQFILVPLAAEQIAQALVTDNDLKKFGIFVCAGDRPTEEELKEAEKAKQVFYRAKLSEGDAIWSRTKKIEHIDDNSRRAAIELGEPREWAFTVEGKEGCPFCQFRNPAGAMRCSGCSGILDVDKAEAAGLIGPENAKNMRAAKVKLKTRQAAEAKKHEADVQKAIANADREITSHQGLPETRSDEELLAGASEEDEGENAAK